MSVILQGIFSTHQASRDAMAREAIELSIEHLQEKKEPVLEGAHPLPTAT